MYGIALAWVQANITSPKLLDKTLRFLHASISAGLDCSFLIGGGSTRSGSPSLMHCFGGELFIFELTDAQAFAAGVDRNGVFYVQARNSTPAMRPPARVAFSLSRLELVNTTLTPTTSIIGRLHYEVLADEPRPWCVRLDYSMGECVRLDYCEQASLSWHNPQQPLSARGVLDVSFLSVGALGMPLFKGPLALFARISDISPPHEAESRLTISNAVATMVQVV